MKTYLKAFLLLALMMLMCIAVMAQEMAPPFPMPYDTMEAAPPPTEIVDDPAFVKALMKAKRHPHYYATIDINGHYVSGDGAGYPAGLYTVIYFKNNYRWRERVLYKI